MFPATTFSARLAAASAALLLLCAPLSGAASRQPDIGVRAISMGGAFVAAASDATAIHWNPAAIATLQRQQVRLSYTDRFGLGLRESYLSYVLPITESHAFGADWFHRGFDDVEEGFGLEASQNRFGFAYGYRNDIERRRYIGDSAVGITGRYIGQKAILDGATAMNAAGFGFDAGLLVPLIPSLRFGLAVQDIGGTAVEHDNGFREDILSTHLRLGLAYKPRLGKVTLAADLDDHFRAGAEYRVSPQLALRAGVKSEIETPESLSEATSLSAGFRPEEPLRAARLRLRESPRARGKPLRLGGARVRPERRQHPEGEHPPETGLPFPLPALPGDRLFRSRDLQLRLRTDTRHRRPHASQAMAEAHTEEIVLPRRARRNSASRPTSTKSSSTSPRPTTTTTLPPVVRVRYTRGEENYLVEKRLERVYLAGKGKLSWNVEGMAAAFVTPADNRRRCDGGGGG